MTQVIVSGAVGICLLAAGRTGLGFTAIDTFDTVNDIVVNVPAGNPPQTGFMSDTPGVGSVLGGERDIYVARLYNDPGLTHKNKVYANIDAPITPGDASQLYYTEVNGRRGEMLVTWDGVDGSSAVDTDGLGGGVGVAVNANPLDVMFALDVSSISVGSTVSLQLWEVGGGNDTWTISAVTTGGSQLMQFMFSDYLSHGIDLAHIGAIQLGWRTSATETGATASFDWFGTAEVPEPGTIALFGGLLGIGIAVGLRKRLVAARDGIAA